MDPLTMWLTIAGLGMGGVGDFMNANAQSNQQQLGAQQFEESRQDQQSNSIANFLNGQMGQDITRAGMGLQSTQMDPYAQAKNLNAANVRSSFASGLGPDGRFSGTLDTSALNPSGLGKSADQFYSQVGVANPNVPVGGMSQVAGGVQGNYIKQQAALRNQIMQYLQMIGQKGPGQNVFNGLGQPSGFSNGTPTGNWSGGGWAPPADMQQYLGRD